MDQFKGKFTRIQDGFSTNRRIPRLGKIRLGLKVQHPKTGKSYPKETPHFVVPKEVAEAFGDEPTELDIFLPSENEEAVFPQKLAYYGSSKGLICHGDGERAERFNQETKKWEDRSCPCEHRKTDENPQGQCAPVGHLMFLIRHKKNFIGRVLSNDHPFLQQCRRYQFWH